MGVLSASRVLSIEIANEALQENTFVSCSPENLLSQANLIMFTAPPPYRFLFHPSGRGSDVASGRDHMFP